jgi:hypothetical protein
MLVELRRISIVFVILAVCLMLTIHPAVAVNEPPTVGEALPPIELAVPKDAAAKSYLGLADSGQFSIPEIKAQAVIIEVFSMY